MSPPYSTLSGALFFSACGLFHLFFSFCLCYVFKFDIVFLFLVSYRAQLLLTKNEIDQYVDTEKFTRIWEDKGKAKKGMNSIKAKMLHKRKGFLLIYTINALKEAICQGHFFLFASPFFVAPECFY